MTSLAAVLFDMDGLLVDTEHLWHDAGTVVMAEYGVPWSDEDSRAMVGGPLERTADFMAARTGAEAAVLQGRLVAVMAELLAGGTEHRPGAVALLDALLADAVPCALVSASPRVLIDAVLRSVGGEHFATTVAADEAIRTKPHPDPYLLAAARLGADPARCVVLEDSPTGVAAGEAAGCVVVAVPFAVEIPPAPGRHIAPGLDALTVDHLRALVRDPRVTPW